MSSPVGLNWFCAPLIYEHITAPLPHPPVALWSNVHRLGGEAPQL